MPQIDLHFQLKESFSDKPWYALPPWIVDARLYSAAVGICFFIPSEVALSLYGCLWCLNGLLQVAAVPTHFEPGRQENTRAMGIYTAYFLGLLWLACGHLKHVILAASGVRVAQEDEPLSYRAMVGGWLICMTVAWVWLIIVGMNWSMGYAAAGDRHDADHADVAHRD